MYLHNINYSTYYWVSSHRFQVDRNYCNGAKKLTAANIPTVSAVPTPILTNLYTDFYITKKKKNINFTNYIVHKY